MKKERAFFTFCYLLASTTIVYMLWKITISKMLPKYHCYWTTSNDGVAELGYGEWDRAMLVPSRCIFFHKTTCSQPRLTPREACAVESAARTNGNLNVYLLLLADGRFTSSSEQFVDILESYNNVYIRRVPLTKYVLGTPIETWFRKYIRKLLAHPDWIRKNFHDYIRMLTLWKYGGIALNLDSVVQSQLDKLTTFAGMRNNLKLDFGVFGIDTSTNFGRKFADTCMNAIANGVNMENYAEFDITRVIQYTLRKYCNNATKDNSDECHKFKIYLPDRFYPVFFASWQNYFNESKTTETMNVIKDAAMIHLWDDYSRNATADRTAAYAMVAKQYCPKVYWYIKGFI